MAWRPRWRAGGSRRCGGRGVCAGGRGWIRSHPEAKLRSLDLGVGGSGRGNWWWLVGLFVELVGSVVFEGGKGGDGNCYLSHSSISWRMVFIISFLVLWVLVGRGL